MNTSALPTPQSPGGFRFNPFVRTGASALVALFAFFVIAIGWIGSIGVFHFGQDRTLMAYASFWVFDFSLLGMLATPWLPLPSLRNHTTMQRLDFMVQVWVVMYVFIAFSFEIPWLLLYKKIALAHDQMWAYQFWSYIDGGDVRYKDPDSLVLFAESWTCLNAIGALVAITAWFRSNKQSAGAALYLMLAAVGHITTSAQYFLTEIFTGFPNESVHVVSNFWAKFVFSNCAWIIMPFVVIYWGNRTLKRLYGQGAARR